MFREQRIVVACRVRFTRLDFPVQAVSEDLSRHGIFVRTEEFLPVGTVIDLHITLPTGEAITVISRVAHLLAPSSARSLGRRPGMGFQFLEENSPALGVLAGYLDDLIDELTPTPMEIPASITVLLAVPTPRLLDRLANALDEAGFLVERATNGAEAYSACLVRAPNVILAETDMPVMDGWTLCSMLASRPRLSDVPVLLMSDDATDITRLRAYRLGVSDFLPKPFTDEELTIRVRRQTLRRSHGADRVTLHGNLAEIGLPTLLSLLEFERKSGVLVVLRDDQAARLFVAAGRVVKVEGASGADARATLGHVLAWDKGNFEFSACEVVGSDEVGMGTTQLLLELARHSDESTRG